MVFLVFELPNMYQYKVTKVLGLVYQYGLMFLFLFYRGTKVRLWIVFGLFFDSSTIHSSPTKLNAPGTIAWVHGSKKSSKRNSSTPHRVFYCLYCFRRAERKDTTGSGNFWRWVSLFFFLLLLLPVFTIVDAPLFVRVSWDKSRSEPLVAFRSRHSLTPKIFKKVLLPRSTLLVVLRTIYCANSRHTLSTTFQYCSQQRAPNVPSDFLQ